MNGWEECSVGLPISMNPQHMRMVFHREKANYVNPPFLGLRRWRLIGLRKHGFLGV